MIILICLDLFLFLRLGGTFAHRCPIRKGSAFLFLNYGTILEKCTKKFIKILCSATFTAPPMKTKAADRTGQNTTKHHASNKGRIVYFMKKREWSG